MDKKEDWVISDYDNEEKTSNGLNDKKCPECGAVVGQDDVICKNCGFPLKNVAKKQEEKKHSALYEIFVLAVIVVVILLIVSEINGKDGKDNTTTDMNTESYSDDEEKLQTETYDGESVQNEEEEKEQNIEGTTYKREKIYSGKKCVFKVTGGDEDGFSIEIKNGSKKDYSFSVNSMAINGIMTQCNMYTAHMGVPSNKKGTMEVNFENEWLDGIDKIEYIDMIIWAYDDAKDFKDFETGILRIKTNNYKGETKFKENGTKTQNVIVKKVELDEDTLSFSVINKNKNYIEFDFENSSINDYALDDDYLFDAIGISVYPNSKAIVNIDISDCVEKNKIKKVKKAEFSLSIRDKGDYFKERMSKKIKIKNNS